jgi:hypothetical protein
MKTFFALGLLFFSLASFAAPKTGLIVCTREYPQWSEFQGEFSVLTRGPALIINEVARKVTWMGSSGGSIVLHGQRNAEGVKIVRIDGRPTPEKIKSVRRTGGVTDYTLEDSLGGQGLLRVNLNGSGSANWQHATDSSREQLNYCTKNVLN